ncbi:MAG TPA: hypothetical protein VKE51_16870 [Vicinamibacterales bacterium]|nr:hypothetical protein [Vicinamibacterales bacterium]
MPRPSAHILAFAERGAEVRYRELRDEIASLMRQFPHLRTLTARSRRASNNSNPALAHNSGTPRRKPRRMSAAARKAV